VVLVLHRTNRPADLEGWVSVGWLAAAAVPAVVEVAAAAAEMVEELASRRG